MMHFVDTNIFLEVLARKGEKSQRCLKFLNTKKGLWTTLLVICEIEWVLRSGYELPRQEVVAYLHKVIALKNVQVEKKNLIIEALSTYENSKIDLIDCLNALLSKQEGISQVYSYDKHFDQLTNIERLEP